jgi:muramoyltetrapeptide carboxypeptidase
MVPAAPPPPLLRPRPLVKGDTIGVVTPSYTPKAPWLLRGVKALEHAGFKVLLDPDITDNRRFKRVEDERRAENFMSVWLDPKVKAVVAATGGYGATRISRPTSSARTRSRSSATPTSPRCTSG